MKLLQRGFTIVELIMVIFTIGVLAAIVINVYGAATVAARDRSREGDARAWAGYFDVYKGHYGVYPALPVSDAQATSACLGTFTGTGGKCVQYNDPGNAHNIDYNATPGPSVSAQTLTNIQRIGNAPLNTGPPTNATAIGPFVYVWQATDVSNNITVTAVFIGFFEGACPTGFTPTATLSTGNPSAYSGLNALLNTIPSNTHPCGLVKTMTYNPTS